MPNTPSFTKPEERKASPPAILGAMGMVDETENVFGSIISAGGGFIKDVFDAGKGIGEQVTVQPPEKTPAGLPQSGELTGFQTPQKPESNPELRTQQLAQELREAHMEVIAQAPVEEKRVKINELNGLQLEYQGSVDAQGNVTRYHEANAERANSELTAEQLNALRQEKLAQATGKQAGNEPKYNLDKKEGNDPTATAIVGAG